ncbi:hypothetical protein [Lysobacter koreensis]
MAWSPASTRRLLLAALFAVLMFPLLGWWLGQLRIFAGVGIVLASVWLVMAGAAMIRHGGRGGDV